MWSEDVGARFSTGDLPDAASVRRWLEYLTDLYCHQDVRLFADRASGAISKATIDDLEVTRYVAGGAQRISRDAKHIADDRIDQFHFVFPDRGAFAYSHLAVERTVQAGQFYMVNSSDPFSVEVTDDASMRCVAIPCDKLRRRIEGIDDFCRSGTSFEPHFLSALLGYLDAITDVDATIDAHRVQDGFIALLSIAMRGARSQERACSADGRSDVDAAAEIGVCMKRFAHAAGFDLTQLSGLTGYSKRKIQYVLSLSGTTFTDEMMAMRLRTAAHLLETGGAFTSIDEISRRCGFSSQSYFSTCFRNRFGVSPRHWRRIGS